VVSFTPWPPYPQGKNPWYPLDRRLGESHSWSGRGGEEKNSQPLLGLEPLIIQPVAHHTTEPTQCSVTEGFFRLSNLGTCLFNNAFSHINSVKCRMTE